MPLAIQGDEGLPLLQLRAAACAVVRIEVLRARRLLEALVLLLLCGGSRRTSLLLLLVLRRDDLLLDWSASAHAFLAQNLLAGVRNLSENR